MKAKIGEVEANLEKIDKLIDDAFEKGAELVIVPEFFTSGVAFHPAMKKAALPLQGRAMELLLSKSRRYNGVVGGSYIALKDDGETYNTFVLAFPDGNYYTHDKDLPTMWENCYYRGGNSDGVIKTPRGSVGVALCWELIRTQTAKRMLDKVDLLVGGSCWWTLPDRGIPLPFKQSMKEQNLSTMKDTPARMAKMLGVAVVHAAHAGEFACNVPWVPGLKYRSYYLGETQIVDGFGKVMARLPREAGEGVITAGITIARNNPSENIPRGFWIPQMHPLIKFFWHYQNLHGKLYYKKNQKRIRV